MEQTLFALVAIGSVVAAIVWGRSARFRQRAWERIRRNGGHIDARRLARAHYRKDLHTTLLYVAVALGAAVTALVSLAWGSIAFLGVLVPVAFTLGFGRGFRAEARIAQERGELERRAQEVLSQDDLAPKRWAERLAPADLPDIGGYDIGRVYQPGSGMMAGDFFDVFRVDDRRVAAVIGDVAGHGIESSITAFQAKYLLRVFLRQFRDPAQAFEELNSQMSGMGRDEEFISLCVVVFDTGASTIRYASAGHPAGVLWHGREVRPIRPTGPLLMLDPSGRYDSYEIPLDRGDLVLLYTDGLTEARNGEQFFGEDRVAQAVRRDPGVAPDVLCKSLLDSAVDFAGGPVPDDVAILAVRKD
ncbi:MAG: PP2C family protein-serine/threonine phosphatase [Acidimicrobiales bacterium]